MIKADQLVNYVIHPTLIAMAPEIPMSAGAELLVIGTIGQESAGGTYIHQLGLGPALGICQMEPNTFYDHWRWLETQHALRDKISEWCFGTSTKWWKEPIDLRDHLISNLRFSVAMCRVHYWRAPGTIPGDLEGCANYWKQWYNTMAGAGTPQEYVVNYYKFVRV